MFTSNNEIVSMNTTATIQFGNKRDTSGYRVVKGEVIAEQLGPFVRVFLVRDGSTFGVATLGERNNIKAQYYCTNAMTLGGGIQGYATTEQDIASHLGFPVELIVVPESSN